MSKLVDKIKQQSGGSSVSFGFKAAVRPKSPKMVLIGETVLKKQFDPSGKSADATLFMGLIPGKDIGTPRNVIDSTNQGAIWGIYLSQGDEERLDKISDSGCDFIVFKCQDMSASVLLDESQGKILLVDASWTDTNLRLLEQIPVDAILFDETNDKNSFSIESFISLKRLAVLSSKPVLVKKHYFPGEKELSSLLSVPVKGLVLPANSNGDLTEIEKLKSLIDKLPPPQGKKASRTVALIPPVSISEDEPYEDDE